MVCKFLSEKFYLQFNVWWGELSVFVGLWEVCSAGVFWVFRPNGRFGEQRPQSHARWVWVLANY